MKDCGGHFHGKHLKRSLDYVMNPEKTQDGRLVGAINCQVDSAFEQMKATKRKFGKVAGLVGKAGTIKNQLPHPHGCHSAKPYSGKGDASSGKYHLCQRSRCAERGNVQHDGKAMARG